MSSPQSGPKLRTAAASQEFNTRLATINDSIKVRDPGRWKPRILEAGCLERDGRSSLSMRVHTVACFTSGSMSRRRAGFRSDLSDILLLVKIRASDE